MKSSSPLALFRTLRTHRDLVKGLVVREVVGRYRGSVMGLLWSFFNPILLLAVYTFVFSYVFKARWTGGDGSKTEFALVLFAGLMVFNMFAEVCNRAPTLVTGNIGYVKKVVFPLEILPIVSLGSSLFHLLVSFVVWAVFYTIFVGMPSATLMLMPLAVLPLVLMTLGFSWILAALGVYLRDVAQVIGVVTLVLMYLSPIFYPVSIMPEQYRPFMRLSPLTTTVEQVRDVLMWGKVLNWQAWGISMAVGLFVAWLGFAWFQKTRRGFADVL
ncbi:ABC transporter permease [Stenotrophomonas sp. AB1(2024)]|uniref:ABC transporter permease n=1 Tax=Stenotrophomonas sp. AB1(2024) TaxID=3132215 RepID=UPI0030AA2DA1